MEVKVDQKDHPVSDEKLGSDFPEYVKQLFARLRKGADAYGDSSFELDPQRVTGELSQEALDIAGWGFILWCRIQDLERKLKDAEARLAEVSPQSPPSPLLNLSLQRLKLYAYRSSRLGRPQHGEPSTRRATSSG
jgi:hypothetical protein